jgi:hypothetical protein
MRADAAASLCLMSLNLACHAEHQRPVRSMRKGRFLPVSADYAALEARVAELEQQLRYMLPARIDAVAYGLSIVHEDLREFRGEMGERLGSIEIRLDRQGEQLDSLSTRMDRHGELLEAILRRLGGEPV